MDIIQKSIGQLAFDLSFSAGALVLSGSDPAIGLAISISVSEAQLLAAGLKLLPAGAAQEIGSVAVGIVEDATAKL